MSGTLIQIAGMPRSGTAFLAAFLSLHPKCVSNHELAATDPNWKETLRDQLERWDFVVDSTTYGWLPKATIEGSKRIGLTRSCAECAPDATEAFLYEVSYEQMVFCRDKVDGWSNGHYSRNYKKMFNVDPLKDIWRHCFGSDEWFSEEKTKLFISLNIQRNRPWEVFSQNNCQRTLEKLL